MINIQFTSNLPDTTYFRVGAVEPFINNNSIIVRKGQGANRNWGKPGLNSYVILHSEKGGEG